MNYNPLTALPESIGNLTNLKWLELAGCKLTSMPESIGQLTKPTNFWLYETPLIEAEIDRLDKQAADDRSRFAKQFRDDHQEQSLRLREKLRRKHQKKLAKFL